ncbi:MAG: ATP-binding protein [Acidobacteriota bacterium]
MASPCPCRKKENSQRLLERAAIPRRYQHCDLDNYDVMGDSQRLARQAAQHFVEAYPAIESGILFMGSCGVGKTHLAVGILRSLATEKGVAGLFVDFRDLLRQIQETYNPMNSTSASQVLRPVLKAEVLVLDDLGATKPTEWVRDTVAHIIIQRYNDRRITIFSTNFGDGVQGTSGSDAAPGEILSDRVGIPLRSRLSEMCRTIVIQGRDYRREIRQAAYRW